MDTLRAHSEDLDLSMLVTSIVELSRPPIQSTVVHPILGSFQGCSLFRRDCCSTREWSSILAASSKAPATSQHQQHNEVAYAGSCCKCCIYVTPFSQVWLEPTTPLPAGLAALSWPGISSLTLLWRAGVVQTCKYSQGSN